MKYYSFLVSNCIILFLIILNTACSNTPNIEGFSPEVWKSDPKGCNNKRSQFVEIIYNERKKIKGLGREHIRELFGKPDFQKLYRRDQRVFIYFHTSGQHCEHQELNMEQGKLIKLRFNSLGLVNEVIIQK